jgi:hypothetical protein
MLFRRFLFCQEKEEDPRIEIRPNFFFWKSKTIFFIFWPPSVQGRSIEAIAGRWQQADQLVMVAVCAAALIPCELRHF